MFCPLQQGSNLCQLVRVWGVERGTAGMPVSPEGNAVPETAS